MRLVFLNQYYPPDVAPTGVMLEAVAEELVRAGHEVTVVCAQGGYGDAVKSAPSSLRFAGQAECEVRSERCGERDAGGGEQGSECEVRNEKAEDGSAGCRVICDQRRQGNPGKSADSGLRVVRIRATRFGRGSFLGKVLDYLSYYVGAARVVLRMQPRPDRVVALTTPPFLSVLARVVSKLRGADHAHWVMDLYPDVMAAHGMMRESAIGYRVLQRLARWGFGGRRCAAVVTLGPDMAERVGRLVGQRLGVHWVPLWGGGDSLNSLVAYPEGQVGRRSYREMRGWADEELVVMYSGNMGLGHRFGEVLELAGRVESGVRWVFFGAGKRRAEIEGFLRIRPEALVELHDYAAADQLTAHLQSADVHLVSLDEGWTGTMVPSKLQGIFAVGRPVIFIGGRDSSIGRWVEESGGGWVVAAGDVDGLAEALDQARDRMERERRGCAALVFARMEFDRGRNSARVAGWVAGEK